MASILAATFRAYDRVCWHPDEEKNMFFLFLASAAPSRAAELTASLTERNLAAKLTANLTANLARRRANRSGALGVGKAWLQVQVIGYFPVNDKACLPILCITKIAPTNVRK